MNFTRIKEWFFGPAPLRNKPDTLAYVRIANGELAELLNGRIVKVVRLNPRTTKLPIWSIEPKQRVTVTYRLTAANGVQAGPGEIEVHGFSDDCLIPIANPSDDADCESKQWLPPVPLPTIKETMV